jgi:hypothetical protein
MSRWLAPRLASHILAALEWNALEVKARGRWMCNKINKMIRPCAAAKKEKES